MNSIEKIIIFSVLFLIMKPFKAQKNCEINSIFFKELAHYLIDEKIIETPLDSVFIEVDSALCKLENKYYEYNGKIISINNKTDAKVKTVFYRKIRNTENNFFIDFYIVVLKEVLIDGYLILSKDKNTSCYEIIKPWYVTIIR